MFPEDHGYCSSDAFVDQKKAGAGGEGGGDLSHGSIFTGEAVMMDRKVVFGRRGWEQRLSKTTMCAERPPSGREHTERLLF